jgi:hypothetical protein
VAYNILALMAHQQIMDETITCKPHVYL